MTTNKPRPYNTLPRFIAEDYLEKKITRNEFILAVWIRAIANPYGITTTSASTIRDDMFPKVEVNTVEKILLSLRKKKYLDYPRHQGKRGSIRIQSDEWLIKGKGVKRISKDSIAFDSNPNNLNNKENNPEVSHNLKVINQNFTDQKKDLVNSFSVDSRYSSITSHHTEHDNDNKNNTFSPFKGTLLRNFCAKNRDEERCKEIATELRDLFINPLLRVLQTRGIDVIEKAWAVYCEDKRNQKYISNPPAYFQGIINKIT